MGKAILSMAASVLLFGCQWESELEVRAFELERLDAAEVVSLIEPYVYSGREENPGYFTVTDKTVTVRELPENLDRIAAVLARFDTPRSTVLLKFQLVAANGYEGSDPEIASVEAELKNLLRYDGYKLVGNTVIQVLEGESARQSFEADGMAFEVEVRLGPARSGGDGKSVSLLVSLRAPRIGDVLETSVDLRDGKTMVLGTGSSFSSMEGIEALILVVTPEIS
ncbi:MAG: hypothetical protein BMS9Abin29_2152 [Gemmatimonadota bacterium]|nr:MAG: hypothetical protein BMS9Abin29_2152 [Gemmatimonadota bacterium]